MAPNNNSLHFVSLMYWLNQSMCLSEEPQNGSVLKNEHIFHVVEYSKTHVSSQNIFTFCLTEKELMSFWLVFLLLKTLLRKKVEDNNLFTKALLGYEFSLFSYL